MKYGNEWKHGNLDTELVLRDVVFTGSRFVAVGDNGKVFRSTDGTNWSGVNSGHGTSDHLFCVAYGDGIMVAAGRDGLIITSEDEGATWTTTNARGTHGTEDIFGIAYGNSVFLAVGEAGTFWTSGKGNNWSTRSTKTYSRSIAFGDGWFMVGSVNGSIYRTYDGTNLTKVGNMGIAVRAIAYGNSMWMAAGRKIATSSNGTNWTIRMTLSDYNIVDQLYSACMVPGSYIAAGEHGLMLTSSDGIVWRKPNPGTRRFIFGMAYGNKIVAAVGNGGPRDPNSLYLYSTHYSLEGGKIPDRIDPIPTPKPIIKITSPNGGEHLTGGTTYNIKWQGSTTFDKVDIEYYNGSDWVVIGNGIKDNGSYSWSVPNNISTTKAKIWIQGWSPKGNPVDRSDDTFTISPSTSITVTTPNGGEVLVKGSAVNITWTSNGEVGNINVSYSTDNGLNWTTIASSIPNNGTLAWKVPDVISDKCLVKVSAESDPRVFDTSNNVFSIKEAFQDQLPFGVIDTPEDGLTGVKGSIPVTGWALDDAGVDSVKVYRKVINGLYYIGDATFSEGTRPDVEKISPGYPNITRAGWGYMLQTNLFPDGKLELQAIATDSTGNLAELGTKTIFLENDK